MPTAILPLPRTFSWHIANDMDKLLIEAWTIRQLKDNKCVMKHDCFVSVNFKASRIMYVR